MLPAVNCQHSESLCNYEDQFEPWETLRRKGNQKNSKLTNPRKHRQKLDRKTSQRYPYKFNFVRKKARKTEQNPQQSEVQKKPIPIITFGNTLIKMTESSSEDKSHHFLITRKVEPQEQAKAKSLQTISVSTELRSETPSKSQLSKVVLNKRYSETIIKNSIKQELLKKYSKEIISLKKAAKIYGCKENSKQSKRSKTLNCQDQSSSSHLKNNSKTQIQHDNSKTNGSQSRSKTTTLNAHSGSKNSEFATQSIKFKTKNSKKKKSKSNNEKSLNKKDENKLEDSLLASNDHVTEKIHNFQHQVELQEKSKTLDIDTESKLNLLNELSYHRTIGDITESYENPRQHLKKIKSYLQSETQGLQTLVMVTQSPKLRKDQKSKRNRNRNHSEEEVTYTRISSDNRSAHKRLKNILFKRSYEKEHSLHKDKQFEKNTPQPEQRVERVTEKLPLSELFSENSLCVEPSLLKIRNRSKYSFVLENYANKIKDSSDINVHLGYSKENNDPINSHSQLYTLSAQKENYKEEALKSKLLEKRKRRQQLKNEFQKQQKLCQSATVKRVLKKLIVKDENVIQQQSVGNLRKSQSKLKKGNMLVSSSSNEKFKEKSIFKKASESMDQNYTESERYCDQKIRDNISSTHKDIVECFSQSRVLKPSNEHTTNGKDRIN